MVDLLDRVVQQAGEGIFARTFTDMHTGTHTHVLIVIPEFY